ncbi:MAG: ROK family transcriptional regulator [Candidatus Promineifilaceae bacterium]|jgi:N-acetylglucosamine repressor
MQKATREQTRSHNKRLILKIIYQEGEISRADIARATGLTRTTVSHIVAELIEEGLVKETGRGPSEGGKPPVLLSLPARARYMIGIDLADSEFRGGLIDLRGDILERTTILVDDHNGAEALDLVYDLIASLIKKVDGTILGIGVGTPGLVNAKDGIVRQSVNLDWQNLPLGDLLRARFNVPIHVGNDSHCAALGQFTFGRQRGLSNLIVVKVGRGIGSGIVLNGRLLYGDNSAAGEIGHVRAVENGAQCRCGHFGCLETVASTRSVVSLARQIATNNPQAAINNLVESPAEITTATVLSAVQSGDAEMCRLITDAGHQLGIAIAHLVGALNIEQIVVAGSMARFGNPLLVAINEALRPRAMDEMVSQTHVGLSDLGQDIVMLGAASLVLSSELGVV